METTFLIFLTLCFLSPGFILSELYPKKKFFLFIDFLFFNNIFLQNISVVPG